MADNVQVDGIKQLNEDEKKRSREIILETIGEKESPAPVKLEPGIVNKRLDGILGFGFGKKREAAKPSENKSTISAEQKTTWQKEIKEIIPPAPAVNEKKEETSVSTPAKNTNFLADIKPQPKIEKVVTPPVSKKVSAPAPLKKVAKVKETKAKKVFWKKKKTLAPAKHNQFPVAKLGLQEKSRTMRQPHLQELLSFSQNWHENSKHFEERINVAVRSSLSWLGIFLIVTIVCYLLFITAVIKTNADNKILRSIDKYLIIPAMITPDGIIDYFQYQDIKNKNNLDSASTKKNIIQQLVIDDLFKRLRISQNKSTDELSKAINTDEEINKVSLERIKKIDELIKQGNDFITIATKYGDETGQLDLTPANRSQYSFGNQIASLNIDSISGIVYSVDGYYIFKVINKSDTDEQLSYVFIRSKSLNDYLTETISDYKVISFVN